jgi:hypothetical protein
VAVDFDNLLDGAGFKEGGGYALFDTEDYALAGRDLGNCKYVRILASSGVELRTPIAVEPSLMASREYSTWKRRPSGEKVLFACELEVVVRDVMGRLT